MSSVRLPCPACGKPRWCRIETNGNGGTRDEWEPCDNKDCDSNKGPTMANKPGTRLTTEQREKVMEVLRHPQHRDMTNREIVHVLATQHGITISETSINITYRPKLATNGNGKHEPAVVASGEAGPGAPRRAVLVEALRTYAGHTSDCTYQEDDTCDCGWIHVAQLLGNESRTDAAMREARYRAGIALQQPFWEIGISVA